MGTEVQLLWAATDGFRLSAAAAYYDAELTSDYRGHGRRVGHGAGRQRNCRSRRISRAT